MPLLPWPLHRPCTVQTLLSDRIRRWQWQSSNVEQISPRQLFQTFLPFCSLAQLVLKSTTISSNNVYARTTQTDLGADQEPLLLTEEGSVSLVAAIHM